MARKSLKYLLSSLYRKEKKRKEKKTRWPLSVSLTGWQLHVINRMVGGWLGTVGWSVPRGPAQHGGLFL